MMPARRTSTESNQRHRRQPQSQPQSQLQGQLQPQSSVPSQTQHWLLFTLERLLAIDAVDVQQALNEASDLVAKAMSADKVDIFLYEAESNSLLAMGVSRTPLGDKQKALGLNRIALANGGRTAEVYLTQRPYLSGHLEHDEGELPGVRIELAVRSVIAVPLLVAGELRGVVQVDSLQPEVFNEYDLRFVEAVSGWVGVITHRADLIEQIRRDAEEEAKRKTAEELVTIIAHDLGNYLTPLRGRIELLMRRAEKRSDAPVAHDASELALVVSRLQRMVSDLLDTGRLEQAMLHLTKEWVDLGELARETAGAMSTPGCPIRVEERGELRAEVDTVRVRQALENLLANAVKHSPEGADVEITVVGERQGECDGVAMTVRDRGPGISPEMKSKLFTRFAAGPESSGLGLGLHLAHGIARAHGGTLTAESEQGAGASFCLWLPSTDPVEQLD